MILLLLLAQVPMNLNLTPVDVRQAGARLSTKRAWAVDCTGAGVTCQSDGGVWTLNITGGGGGGSTPTVSCTGDQALTWNGTTWACISKVREAFMADAGISAQWAFAADASVTARQFDHDPAACGAGQYASDIAADGTLTCSTPAGGGGGGSQNVASTTVSFGTGGYDATGTVTAAWASTTSVIVCAPLGEEASVDGITAFVTGRASGSFTVRAQPMQGRGVGTYTIHCTGL